MSWRVPGHGDTAPACPHAAPVPGGAGDETDPDDEDMGVFLGERPVRGGVSEERRPVTRAQRCAELDRG